MIVDSALSASLGGKSARSQDTLDREEKRSEIVALACLTLAAILAAIKNHESRPHFPRPDRMDGAGGVADRRMAEVIDNLSSLSTNR